MSMLDNSKDLIYTIVTATYRQYKVLLIDIIQSDLPNIILFYQ